MTGPRSRIKWRVVEPGMHVGTTDGRVCGYVVESSGAYVSFTGGQTPIGRFDTLDEARRATAQGR